MCFGILSHHVTKYAFFMSHFFLYKLRDVFIIQVVFDILFLFMLA